MKLTSNVKLVGIKFNNTAEKAQTEHKKAPVRRKFVTGAKLSDEGKEKLKRVFSIINRARYLAVRYIKESPDISLMDFKSKVMNALTKETLNHVVSSMVNQEMYHIHRVGAKDIDEIKPESKSVSFYEGKMVNNRFTISYRRDKIVIEDLDIMLDLDNRIPRIDESKQFYLNICVDDLFKMNYIYINVTYTPPSDTER